MKPTDQPMPRARDEGLVIQELPDETLVYDLRSHKAHALNEVAAQVWRRCDGRSRVSEVATLLEQELTVPLNEEAVWLAIDRLARARLLYERPASPPSNDRLSRRTLVRHLAAAGGLALITSIVAPEAHAARSRPNGAICSTNSDCQSNHCVACTGVVACSKCQQNQTDSCSCP